MAPKTIDQQVVCALVAFMETLPDKEELTATMEYIRVSLAEEDKGQVVRQEDRPGDLA